MHSNANSRPSRPLEWSAKRKSPTERNVTSTEEQSYSHPVDILSARRWQSALFTTYAFSISFFESVVFRALTHRSPCEEICVIVDTDGYSSSLMERGATRVGRDYTLVPVLAPGVFHPKCTYLSGLDGDLLLVGSGNLTFGGYGRNIEVLEVLQPQTHPEAFADFANFLEALVSTSRSEIANPVCVENFIKRARTAALTVPDNDSAEAVRLLHSCEEASIVQLETFTAPYGTPERITVLSPFHDSNGSAM